MKVIVAGSREGFDLDDVYSAIEQSGFEISEVVSGTARGVDSLGEEWANENDVKIIQFPAQWDTYGKRAGYLRNSEMAVYADALVALWDGNSRGTKHMIDLAHSKQLEVFVYQKV